MTNSLIDGISALYDPLWAETEPILVAMANRGGVKLP